jgi:ribosomal protein L37AE/L43A
MQKTCVKCDTEMTLDRGVWTCTRCLDEIVSIKRQMLEEATAIAMELSSDQNEKDCV